MNHGRPPGYQRLRIVQIDFSLTQAKSFVHVVRGIVATSFGGAVTCVRL